MSTTITSHTTSSSTAAAASSSISATLTAPPNLKVVGILLAVASGLLIGSSFVFKKKGLLRSQAGGEAGEGVAYLKSPLWWTGMIMMITGEICNFAAYAFVEAIVVTPLGALSVVICAILSSLFLNEKLSFFGWLGCGLCILGSIIIALNGPKEESVGQIKEFEKLFLAPGFLAWTGLLIASSLTIIFYFAPKYGKTSMLWYISVCSMIGGLSVSVTTGLGAAIVQTALGDNQFKHWFLYFLLGFVVVTLLTEVYYLNVALALFNTAMVTPTYYVIFTFFSMVTTIVLFDGLKASAAQILTLVLAFLVICVGITILQMSKIDPANLKKLDRRSTMLLQAARSQTEMVDEKALTGIEDPGMDALRGSFGTVGSIIRARSARRMSQSSRAGGTVRPRMTSGLPFESGPQNHPYATAGLPLSGTGDDPYGGMQRHQLYDAPMPPHLSLDDSSSYSPSLNSAGMAKKPTIKFGETDLVHQYNRPGTGDTNATHQTRQAIGSPVIRPTEYPPMPNSPSVLLPPPPSPLREKERGVDLLKLDDDEPALPTGMSGRVGSNPLTDGGSGIGAKGSGGGTTNDRQQSSFIIPPLLSSDPAIRSAPPTLQQRFGPLPPLPGGAIPRPGPVRKDSRDIFGSGHRSNASAGSAGSAGAATPKAAPGARSDGPLVSFTSMSDSAPSERSVEIHRRSGSGGSGSGSIGANSTRAVVGINNTQASVWDETSPNAQEKAGSVRGRQAKRYPKGDGDDDREESISLWQRGEGERRGTGLTSEEESGADEPSLDSLPGGGIRLVKPGGGNGSVNSARF